MEFLGVSRIVKHLQIYPTSKFCMDRHTKGSNFGYVLPFRGLLGWPD